MRKKFSILTAIFSISCPPATAAPEDPCGSALVASFENQIGTREDFFFHVEVDDPLWARQILPRRAFASDGLVRSDRLKITRGNVAFPNIVLDGEYVTYFDQFEMDAVTGSREAGHIKLHLKSGLVFEMVFGVSGNRRLFELWVHGLTGPTASKKILSARSGMEVTF